MEEKVKKPDKKRSSILKKPTDPDISDCTDTKTKLIRRISFSGKKSVKEFIQDEEKNTVWGTSYEESAESNMPLNSSSPKTKGRKEDYNLSVEMDIEPEFVVPLCPINPMNKENETPDNTISASINMGRKVPLASSTMLVDAVPLATPPRKKDPFSWLKDPKIVGATHPMGEDSDETGSVETTFNYVPSPMSVSLMNRDTTCFEVSSLHIEEHKRRHKVKKTGKLFQEMDISACQDTRKSTGVEVARKTIYFPAEQDQMSLTGTCERSRKGNQMELTIPGTLVGGEKDCMEMSMEEDVKKPETNIQEATEAKRKTIVFPDENNQMNFTVVQEVSGGKSLLNAKDRKRETDQTVFFPLEDNQMSMTEILPSNPTDEMSLCNPRREKTCQKSRKTVYFPPEENQMNLTGLPGQNPIQEMSLCSKDPEEAVPKGRKTIYFPSEDNQMDMTRRPGDSQALEMSLAPQDPVTEAKKDRRTVYFPPEECQMNFTKLPEDEGDLECVKTAQKDRKTIYFPQEENQMKILVIPQDPEEKTTRKNRQSVYFTEEDNQMDMTAIPEKVKLQPKSPLQMSLARDREKSHQKMRETVYFPAGSDQMNVTGVSRPNPGLEMSICASDPEKTAQRDRKTVFFPPDENQMNVTGVLRPNPGLEMSICASDPEKTAQRDRKTVFFPPDENQMNVTGVSRPNPGLEMSICASDPEKTAQRDRKTVIFPPDENQMNVTEAVDQNRESNMSLITQKYEKTAPNSRKTVYFPPEGNQMNLTELSGENYSLDVTLSTEDREKKNPETMIPPAGDRMDLTGFSEKRDAEKTALNSRKTVYFPDENNQMNITEVSDEKTKEIEENPIIGGARRKIWTSVARISPFCRRESTGNDENPSSSPSLYLNEGLETLPMDISLGEGAYGGRVDETIKSLGLEFSEDNTMKICEALHREQRRHQNNFSSDNSKVSGDSCELTRFLEDEAPDMKMLMEESYIEANSLSNNPLSSNEKTNYDDSIIKLSNVRCLGNIRRKTFTIQRHSKIPVPESRTATPDVPRCSSVFQEKSNGTLVSLPNVEEEEVPMTPKATAADNSKSRITTADQPTLLKSNEALVSLQDPEEEEELKIPGATAANTSKSLKDFLESDLYGKTVESGGSGEIMRTVLEAKDQVVALHRQVEPFKEFFNKYPSRCQLPRCPSYKELIHNVVNTCCPNIWFIDFRMEDGWLMFKHRKITTIEIWMKFDRKQLRDMDSVNSRGKLTFKRINIRDTNWYSNADPARKSKIWIYLNTKFRSQVLSDAYLLGKYYDSSTLRDFLQYIDQLCCDIYAARPHILDIIRMYR